MLAYFVTFNVMVTLYMELFAPFIMFAIFKPYIVCLYQNMREDRDGFT